MAKKIVFLTSESIAGSATESIHLYRRMVSFKKSGDVAVITQSNDNYPEQAGCEKVVHLGAINGHQEAALVTKQADLFVVVGMSPNDALSAELLYATEPECCIAIINKGCINLPKGLYRKNVFKMRDMSIGTGLIFLSMYRWLKDLIEE